jgi:hypothetical protein
MATQDRIETRAAWPRGEHRDDRDQTSGLPVAEAHALHNRFRAGYGATQQSGRGIASRREAVLSRSREQRNS